MDLQAIYIRSHQERSKPEQHIAYAVEVHAANPSKTWTVWRRYSEFEALIKDIEQEMAMNGNAMLSARDKGKGRADAFTMPDLPPKRAALGSVLFTPWRGISGNNDAQFVRDRQEGLERWLRSILGARDGQAVRQTHAFKAFLEVPAAATTSGAGGARGRSAEYAFTSQSWLDEYHHLEALAKEIQSQLARRDTLASQGDSTASHQANVEAKRLLAALMNRITGLTKGLDDLGGSKTSGAGASAVLSEGELRRRTDLLARIQDRAEVLGKMALATNASTRGGAAAKARGGEDALHANSASRDALLGAGTHSKPVTRVLGQKAKPIEETAQTRALDNSGLLQLQMQEIDQVRALPLPECASSPLSTSLVSCSKTTVSRV